MTIKTEKTDGTTTVSLTGRLDTITAPELEAKLGEILDGTNELIFDFTALDYVSSAGLRTLLSAQKKIQGNGTMKLRNLNENVLEIMEVTGFSSIMTIE
ncbi:anti-sigma F factor antagonist [Oribacterium sp. C9]|uniref:STAS domain-containing protein n=1 Tax=Oribacterium sp. C9 TaxID=1943579 RepID=UPI00098F87CB|nr:STAS domain-containing protein [Oribacterium sp. C9]OON88420.1 anti-sigma F factor antagonist [Oribacterium sp. C9]